MRNSLPFTNTILLSVFLLAASQEVTGQISLFDVSIFDDKVLEIGYREDSLLQADEILFALEEQKVRAQKNAAMRRGLPENKTEEPLAITEHKTPENLREQRLSEFPAYLAKTVPMDAIFLEVENGEGINVQPMDGNHALILIEDKYEQILALRFEKLRINTLVVRVYGHDGRLVYNNKIVQKPKGYELKLNTQKWPKGIYRFQFKIDDGSWKEKVMVKNSVGS